jgi:UDPglucose 6-dehydrogenase
MEAATGADAICIITEWDEFKTVDYQQVFNVMRKPAFAFDGRNILDHQSLRSMGFIMYSIGKPLHSFFFSSSSATQ